MKMTPGGRPIITALDRRVHAYVYAIPLWGIFAGLGLLFTPLRSRSLDTALPEWAMYLWAVALILGSATVLYTVYRKNDLGEMVGQIILAGGSAIYGISIVATDPRNTIVAGLTYAVFVGVCLWRIGQIQAARREVHAEYHRLDRIVSGEEHAEGFGP